MKVRIRVEHESAAVCYLEEVGERVFQLSGGAGDGCAVVPGAEGGGTQIREEGKASNRREVRDESQPFGVEPVKPREKSWGRVE